jgi:hypothetical protein
VLEQELSGFDLRVITEETDDGYVFNRQRKAIQDYLYPESEEIEHGSYGISGFDGR